MPLEEFPKSGLVREIHCIGNLLDTHFCVPEHLGGDFISGSREEVADGFPDILLDNHREVLLGNEKSIGIERDSALPGDVFLDEQQEFPEQEIRA